LLVKGRHVRQARLGMSSDFFFDNGRCRHDVPVKA
jgi:hypothetical protein